MCQKVLSGIVHTTTTLEREEGVFTIYSNNDTTALLKFIASIWNLNLMAQCLQSGGKNIKLKFVLQTFAIFTILWSSR